jgi:hypothetical protein
MITSQQVPHLTYLLQSYFHLDSGDNDASIIESFVNAESRRLSEDVCLDLNRVLSAKVSETTLQHLVESEMHCPHNPLSVGSTHTAWLRSLSELLEQKLGEKRLQPSPPSPLPRQVVPKPPDPVVKKPLDRPQSANSSQFPYVVLLVVISFSAAVIALLFSLARPALRPQLNTIRCRLTCKALHGPL